MRVRAVLAVAVATTAAALGAAGTAEAAGYLVGAARVDTTPQAWDAAGYGRVFPESACPRALYPDHGHFLLEEPYRDLNGDGRFEYGDLFCDANHNGRYDGIYDSGGVDRLATGVDDPIDARAISISAGRRTYVVVSVVAQGLHENYIEDMRARARTARPGISDVIVSANHNESSPDTVGIYGGPEAPELSAGLNSGIDDYYMDDLDQRVADAAVAAYDRRRPATLYARQFPLPAGVCVRLSTNFPTTYDDGSPAAIDPKVGVLQARDRSGRPMVTVTSLAAHNQEIGHSGSPRLSSDWPGALHRALESGGAGMGMFLVGDNGSEEDPVTQPPVDRPDGPGCLIAERRRSSSGREASSARAGSAPARTTKKPCLRLRRA